MAGWHINTDASGCAWWIESLACRVTNRPRLESAFPTTSSTGGDALSGDPMNPTTHEAIPESFITEVCERLRRGDSVKRSLPGGGLLSIDRELPFLCVYRRNPKFSDAGTRYFANHEAAYLSAPGDAPERPGMASLVQRIAEQASRRFGAFLILEIC